MKKNIRPFELQLANSLGICNDPIKKAIANASNQIRKKHGLPELSLAFFEESEHPRGEHGRFASKGSARGGGSSNGSYERESYYPRERQGFGESSRFGEFEGRTYDREQVQREMSAQEEAAQQKSAEKLHNFLKVLAAIGGMKLALMTGHPVIAFLLGGYASIKIASAIINTTAHIVAKYGTKATIGAGKIAAEPFAAVGRGVYEGVSG